MLLLFPMLPLTGWAEDEPSAPADDAPAAASSDARPERPRLELLRADAGPSAPGPPTLRKTA